MTISIKHWYDLTPCPVRTDAENLEALQKMILCAVVSGITTTDEIYSVVNRALAGRSSEKRGA